MAKMTIKGLDEYYSKISKLGKNAPEIAKKVVMAGASPVADEIRKGLEANLAKIESVSKDPNENTTLFKTGRSTGDLLNSFGIAPPGVDSYGNTNTKIGFEGYDSKGIPNALKARAMESGTSTLRKRPFVRPAVNNTKGKAIKEMGRKLDEEIKIYAL